MSIGPARKLRISRILVFTTAILVLRTLVSFMIAGFAAREQVDAQLILQYFLGYTLDFVVVALVFWRLAMVQAELLFIHVVLVVVLHELLSVALQITLMDATPTSPLWFLDYAVLLFSVVIGTKIGKRLRASKCSDMATPNGAYIFLRAVGWAFSPPQ